MAQRHQRSPYHPLNQFIIFCITTVVVGVYACFSSPVAYAAPLGQFSCGRTMTVANATDLNAAIVCFNTHDVAEEVVITLNGNINLTAPLTPINNRREGISLRLKGAKYTVDGNQTHRIFEIAEETSVVMEEITIANGKVAGGRYGAPVMGGGILNHGTLSIIKSTIRENTIAGDLFAYGGGIYNEDNGILTIQESTVSENSASDSGGGIWNDGTLSIISSRFSGNSAGIHGGGIWNRGTLSILASTVSGNTASDDGGGIFVNSGTVTITNTTISENNAPNEYSAGGGITNFYGSLTITGSTINENTVGGRGGGIWNAGTLKLINSTLSGNQTNYPGGGIWNWGSATLINSTLSDNEGGIFNDSGEFDRSQLNLANTIIANSIDAGDCVNNGGIVTDHGHNLIEDDGDNACGLSANQTNGNIIGHPALLGPLQDNGGPTWTHALLLGSPAINAGNPATPGSESWACPPSDQRGRDRLYRCDIGAFELEDTSPPVVIVTGVTDGATYVLGSVPTAGCDTQDAISGVATPATLQVTGGNANGTGTFTATCSGAKDNAGHVASPVSVTYTVEGILIATCGAYSIYQAGSDFYSPTWPGAVLVGTNSANILIGSDGPDLILGLGGNDKIDGKGGNDILCGGDGVDQLLGGAGDDYLDGGAGNDVLNGGAGDHDILLAGEGNDTLLDGDGVAQAHGGPGTDGFTIALRNGWLDPQGDASFAELTAGYGNDTIGLANLGATAIVLHISGDEQDTSPNAQDGTTDALTLAGPFTSDSTIIKFERQTVTAAGAEGGALSFAGFLIDPTTLTDESGAEFLTEPVGQDVPVQDQQLFLPLVAN
jgi:hypothetical protein